jgi:hypothetical protein
MALGALVVGVGLVIPAPPAKIPFTAIGIIIAAVGGIEYFAGRILPDEPWDWYSSAPKPNPIEQGMYFDEIRQGRRYREIPFPPLPVYKLPEYTPLRRSDRWLTPKQ